MRRPLQSVTLPTRHVRRGTRRIRLALLLILPGLLAGFGRFSTARADVSPASVAAYSFPPSQLAFADFDGDLRPDLARVQSAPNDGGISKYSIQLRLTKTGIQSISLVAPAGGLWIEARDVNGDHAIDLIFATAWFKQPVAIFLNDGHGRFSRAKPETFPAAFRGSSEDWRFHSEHVSDTFGAPSPSSASGTSSVCLDVLSPTVGFRPWSTRARLNSFWFHSHRGRAPPSTLPS
jgi:hypothetical protein